MNMMSILRKCLKPNHIHGYCTNNNRLVLGLSNLVRQYATNDRTTELKYMHGKLIVEEEENLFLYPKILMTLTGTDESVLENYFHFVKKAAKMTDVNVTKSFSMPAYEESFKAKQEGEGLHKQVEYNFKQFQRIIEVTDLTADKCDLFLDYAQRSFPAGVKMSLEAQRWEMLVDPNHISLRGDTRNK